MNTWMGTGTLGAQLQRTLILQQRTTKQRSLALILGGRGIYGRVGGSNTLWVEPLQGDAHIYHHITKIAMPWLIF